MPTSTYLSPPAVQTLFSALLGWVVGAVLQLQQVALWSASDYGCFVAMAPVLIAVAAIKKIANTRVLSHSIVRHLIAVVVMTCVGFAATGLRATVFLQDQLNSALEGRDVRVTGVVVNLPQRNEAALRFRLQVESAQTTVPAPAQPVRLPPHPSLYPQYF